MNAYAYFCPSQIKNIYYSMIFFSAKKGEDPLPFQRKCANPPLPVPGSQPKMFQFQVDRILEKSWQRWKASSGRNSYPLLSVAMRAYAKQAGDSSEMQNMCAEIKLRAERRGGELLG
jgi:hypothetical protein